ncbi:MAG: biotin/lipoyl-containing protein [Pseudomonadota bacterium]|nr:biotin/lipoyl-containing protein [Pseudomonadota bacterium]
MTAEIVVPQLGNEGEEAEVTEWVATEGSSVAEGEIVVVISTSKTEIEIEAPASGTLTDIYVAEGELTKTGSVLGKIN